MTRRLQVDMSKNHIMFKRALNIDVHSNRNILLMQVDIHFYLNAQVSDFLNSINVDDFLLNFFFNQSFMQLSSSSHIYSEGKIVLKQTHLESRW